MNQVVLNKLITFAKRIDLRAGLSIACAVVIGAALISNRNADALATGASVAPAATAVSSASSSEDCSAQHWPNYSTSCLRGSVVTTVRVVEPSSPSEIKDARLATAAPLAQPVVAEAPQKIAKKRRVAARAAQPRATADRPFAEAMAYANW